MRAAEAKTCCRVERYCKAPANLTEFYGRLAQCFRCGEDVCTADGCSKRVTYLRYGRKRLCGWCIEDAQSVGDVRKRAGS